MELPIYQITLKDDEHGVDKISLVTEPAIEENWLAFDKAETNFNFANEEEQKLIGALLVPDKKIYRNDPELGEFYVVFTSETIEEIALRYNKNGYATQFNTEHTTDVSNVVLTENWIVKDSNFDKSKAYGLEYPVGSWVGLAKVEDEKLWGEIKANLKGFSVELLSSLSYTEFKEEVVEEVPTDKQMLEWLGEKAEDLDFYEESDEWIVEEEEEIEMDSDFAITSKPNEKSKYDNENYRIRYRYTGGNPIKTTREFCREMMTTYKRKIFRYEDINQMSFRKENSEFGMYSIWKFKGSFGCRHRWVKVPIRLIKAKGDKKPPNPPNWYDAKRLNKNLKSNNSKQNNINNNNSMEFKIKFEAMAVLADGSTVYTPTEWVAGALVYAGENEEASLASAGEYTLESGEVLVVEDGGVVVELKPVAEEAAEEDLAQDEAVAESQNYATEIANLTSRVEAMEAKLNEVNGEESKTEDFSKQVEAAVRVALSKTDGSMFATVVTDSEKTSDEKPKSVLSKYKSIRKNK